MYVSPLEFITSSCIFRLRIMGWPWRWSVGLGLGHGQLRLAVSVLYAVSVTGLWCAVKFRLGRRLPRISPAFNSGLWRKLEIPPKPKMKLPTNKWFVFRINSSAETVALSLWEIYRSNTTVVSFYYLFLQNVVDFYFMGGSMKRCTSEKNKSVNWGEGFCQLSRIYNNLWAASASRG